MSDTTVGRADNVHFSFIYTNSFVVGIAIMSFEMLGSRYVNPFFGGSINTWAALISTVLLALMAGYFGGGIIADRKNSEIWLGSFVIGAAGYITLVPGLANPFFTIIWEVMGDGAAGVLTASIVLLFVPVAMLGVFTPYAVKILLHSTEVSGRVTGRVYAISTLGNIFGTLFTTFYLIPNYGTRRITYYLACVLLVSGVSLIWAFWPKSQKS